MEKIADFVEEVAEEIAEELPEGGKLRKVANFVENVAQETAKDAQFVIFFIFSTNYIFLIIYIRKILIFKLTSDFIDLIYLFSVDVTNEEKESLAVQILYMRKLF